MWLSGHPLAVVLLFATTLSSVLAKGSSSGAGNTNAYGRPASYPDGMKPEYVKARSELDKKWVNWDLAACRHPTAGRTYDKYGCCFVPRDFPVNWEVNILGPLDDSCIDLVSEGGIPLEWSLNKSSSAPESATALFYTTRQGKRDTDDVNQNQIIQAAPVCLVDGSITFSIDPPGPNDPFKQDSTWISGLVPIPKAGAGDFAAPLALTPGDSSTGGPWLTRDCNALADKIRKGEVPYPPKNRFALAALSKSGGTGKGGGNAGPGKGKGKGGGSRRKGSADHGKGGSK